MSFLGRSRFFAPTTVASALTKRGPVISNPWRRHLYTSSPVQATVAATQRPGRIFYSQEQLDRYFDRICLPKDQRIFSVSDLSSAKQLEYLSTLEKHHLVKVPYENLLRHYSWHRNVNVKQRRLFQKIVGGDAGSCGRGGYCMETNMFFHTVLVSLGFDVILAGSRIYEPINGKYAGLIHCVNVARVGGTRYLLDVGFGAYGPPKPLALIDSSTHSPEETERAHAGLPHIGPTAEMRVIRKPISQQLDQSLPVWVYQFRPNSGSDWADMACFHPEFEFLPEDVQGMNMLALSPDTFTSSEILVQRFTTSREVLHKEGRGPGSPGAEDVAGGELDGGLMLYQNILKWRRNGEVKLEIRLKSEDERIAALRDYFGIILTDEEVESIKGSVGELKSSWFGAAVESGAI